MSVVDSAIPVLFVRVFSTDAYHLALCCVSISQVGRLESQSHASPIQKDGNLLLLLLLLFGRVHTLNAHPTVSLFLCVCHSLPICICDSVSLSFSLCVHVSLCVSASLCLFNFLSVFLSVFSLFISLSLCLFLPLSPCLSLCLCLCVF